MLYDCTLMEKKKDFVKKENFNDKFNESKLSHETDCHRFDKYKYKKPF